MKFAVEDKCQSEPIISSLLKQLEWTDETSNILYDAF